MRWSSNRRSKPSLQRIVETRDVGVRATSVRLLAQGRAAERAGDWSAAERLYRQARAAAQSAGDQQTAARVEQNLGALADVRGDVPSALLHYASALARHRQLDNHRAATEVLTRMALAHAGLGEHDAALACFDHARGLVQERSDERLLAQVELQCAAMHVRNREFDRARRVCDAAHRIYVGLDDRAGLTACDRLYGQVYRESGRYDLAALHLDLAARTAERESDALLAAGIEHDHATLHLERGDARGAIERLNRAHALCVAVAPYGEQVGVDILLQRIDATYVRALEQWASDLLGPRDAYTLDHCRRVAGHAVELGRALGLRDRALTWLHIGAFLHDIGKAVVPCSILEKPAALDGEERRLIERHALIGAQIVAALELPFDLAPVVRHHHERWDGSGYPDALAGEAIPLHARIVAVADVHDAVTSTRIYSMPCDAETAAGILEGASGRGLDPALVSAFRETSRASVH